MTVTSMLDRFDAALHLFGEEAERLIRSILRFCGYKVTDSGFVENPDLGTDCYFMASMDGHDQCVGVEIKSGARRIGVDSVKRALAVTTGGRFDRGWIVSSGGFTMEAERFVAGHAAGKLDLLTSNDLRNWVAKQVSGQEVQQHDVAIIRRAMQELAREIALHPESLHRREWRDLERILREVFERMGFHTMLTQPGKDGGFDLELSTKGVNDHKTFLVEIKHWSEKRPGASVLKKLVKVSIERAVDGALLLSTSGFTRTINSGLLEAVAPPIHLGDNTKLVGLCKTYYRLTTGYWLEEALPNELYDGTIRVPPPHGILTV